MLKKVTKVSKVEQLHLPEERFIEVGQRSMYIQFVVEPNWSKVEVNIAEEGKTRLSNPHIAFLGLWFLIDVQLEDEFVLVEGNGDVPHHGLP